MALVMNGTSLIIFQAYATGKTFYMELVTTAPVATITTNSQLTKATGGNYAPVVLANMSTSINGTDGAKLDFDDPSWVGLYTTAATPIVGGVICQRVGASPAGTDPALVYIALNSSYTPATSSGSATDVTVTLSTSGVLRMDAN